MESIKTIIPSVLAQFQNPVHDARQRLWSEWPKIVGKNLAEQTRPSLGTNGVLFVWVNESTLAFELNQKYKQTLLRRAQAAVGEEIQSVIIRVGELR